MQHTGTIFSNRRRKRQTEQRIQLTDNKYTSDNGTDRQQTYLGNGTLRTKYSELMTQMHVHFGKGTQRTEYSVKAINTMGKNFL